MRFDSPAVPLRLPRLLTLEEILNAELPPPDWVVEPLIASDNRVVPYGEFGAFKTWLLEGLALSIAAGRDWLGVFHVPRARRVLYIDEEMNERTVRRRFRRLAAGLGLQDVRLPLRVVCRPNIQMRAGIADELLGALAEQDCEPEVIIIDTLRRVLVGSENDSEEIGAFWANVTPLVADGRTVIISHHMRKPKTTAEAAGRGGRNRERASGSTDILAGADCAFAIQRLPGIDAVIVEHVKSRESEEQPPFVVSLHDDGPDSPMEIRYGGPVRTFAQEGRKASRAADDAIAFLRDHPERKASLDAMLTHLEAMGYARRTVERGLSDARKQGRMTTIARGMWTLSDGPVSDGIAA